MTLAARRRSCRVECAQQSAVTTTGDPLENSDSWKTKHFVATCTSDGEPIAGTSVVALRVEKA